MSNTIKVILITVVIIAIGAFGYWYATSGSTPDASTSALQSSNPVLGGEVSPLAADDTAISDKFLALLLNMRTIKLDQSIFADAAFTSLKDFSTTITPEANPGRANPFAPIGVDAAGAQALVVTTGLTTAITKNTATFIGALPIGSVVTKRYFEYGTVTTTPLPNITAGVQGDVVSGAFTFNITGLTPNTTYYVRAATVANGATIYGQIQSFKTLAQ